MLYVIKHSSVLECVFSSAGMLEFCVTDVITLLRTHVKESCFSKHFTERIILTITTPGSTLPAYLGMHAGYA